MRKTRKLRKKSHKKTRSFRKMKGRGELDDIPFYTNDFSFIGQNNENKRKKTEDIKEYNKNYYQENKDERKVKDKEYYEQNKDKKKEKRQLLRLKKKRMQEENDVANILLGLSNNNLVSNANINTNKSQGIKRTMKRKLNT